MKKLSLNKMKLEAGDMLQREQLKTVFGGYNDHSGDGCCIDLCQTNSDCGAPEVDESCMMVRFKNGCRARRCIRNFD